MSNPYIAVSELTNVIYIVDGKKKYDVTKEVMGAVILTHRAIPIEKLEQIRAEIESKLQGVNTTLDVLVKDDALIPTMKTAKATLEEVLDIFAKAIKEQNE